MRISRSRRWLHRAIGLLALGWLLTHAPYLVVMRAAFTLVGQDYEVCSSSVATCTFGTGVAANAGDLVFIGIGERDIQSVTGINDGVNGAYTCPASADFTQGGVIKVQGCYFINSGAGTVTPAVSGSPNGRYYMNFQVWRPNNTVTIDQIGEGGNGSGTTHVVPSISTGANAALVVGWYGFSGAITDFVNGAGYTELTNDSTRAGGEYDITSVGSGSFDCTATTTASVQSAGVCLSFNDAAAGATCRGDLLLLKAGGC